MRAWGGEHEAQYKDEMKLLKMVTAKEHAEASAFCQLVSLSTLLSAFTCRVCVAIGFWVVFVAAVFLATIGRFSTAAVWFREDIVARSPDRRVLGMCVLWACGDHDDKIFS